MLEDDSDGAGPAVVEAAPTAPTAEEVAAAEKAKQDELDALFAAELGMPVKKAKPATKVHQSASQQRAQRHAAQWQQ